MRDPVEKVVKEALDSRGIIYRLGDDNDVALDFYLPAFGLYIEVKQFHSDRISEQMSRAENVIAIQGLGAARAFATLIRASAERRAG